MAYVQGFVVPVPAANKQAYTKLASYNPEWRFKTWVMTITNNLCIDKLRRRKLEPTTFSDYAQPADSNGEERELEFVSSELPPDAAAALNEQRRAVGSMLKQLPAEDRSMVVLDDPLPAGLEAVDLSLRTVSPFAGEPLTVSEDEVVKDDGGGWYWGWGSWDSGMWSAFDHTEIRDDRVVYFARRLWRGRYDATYLARATTAGRFVSAPAQAEEMYNPGVHGRSGGGLFTVRPAGR